MDPPRALRRAEAYRPEIYRGNRDLNLDVLQNCVNATRNGDFGPLRTLLWEWIVRWHEQRQLRIGPQYQNENTILIMVQYMQPYAVLVENVAGLIDFGNHLISYTGESTLHLLYLFRR